MRKQIITPQAPVFMAGLGARTRKNEGILDELFAKVVLLRDDKANNLLIIALDVLGGDRSFVNGIKDALSGRFGLKHEEVLINFTHTHASVYLTGDYPDQRRGNYSMGQDDWPDDPNAIDYSQDMEYYRDLKTVLLHLTDECMAGLQPGTLEMGIGRSQTAVNRRMMTDNGLRWIPNDSVPIDDDLTVLKLSDVHCKLQSIVYCFGCHPTTMNHMNNQLSGEFVGHASRLLEEQYEGASAVFLQGCAGDLKPRKSADGNRFKACDVTEMREAGAELARDVNGVMRAAVFMRVLGPFRTWSEEIRLSTEPANIQVLERQAEGDPRGVFYQNAAKRLLHLIRRGEAKEELSLYAMVWQLDRETCLIALENEIPTDYSLLLKHRFPDKKLIVLGYSNGVYSYIPTRKILEEGGYEADHPLTAGYRGRFSYDTEDKIISAVSAGLVNERG